MDAEKDVLVKLLAQEVLIFTVVVNWLQFIRNWTFWIGLSVAQEENETL